MAATIIDLISDMKTCLALALGTGLVSGYLYTKLKARELYNPDIKNLKKKIKHSEESSLELENESENIKKEISNYNKKIDDTNLEISKYKQEVSELESNLKNLHLDNSSIVNDFQVKKDKLDRYTKEIDELKLMLGVKDISNIEEYKTDIKTKSIKITDSYLEKCDMFDGLVNEVKSLQKENINISSKIDSLKALLSKKELEFKDTNKKLSSIRGELQKRYEQLLQTKNDNLSQIEKYKKQLIDLKNKLS